jgi:hypothetical protein
MKPSKKRGWTVRHRATIAALLLLAAAGSTAWGGEAKDSEVPRLDESLFRGFEKCGVTDELYKALDALFRKGAYTKTESGLVKFTVRATAMGLPVEAIERGICDDGSFQCGFSTFLCMTIPMPFDRAKQLLEEKYRVDFTKEERDPFAERTLRPVLMDDTERHGSILYCDSGTL